MVRSPFILIASCLLVPGACAPLPQLPFSVDADLSPPRIVTMDLDRQGALVLGFDEPCELLHDAVVAGDTLRNHVITTSWTGEQTNLVIGFDPLPEMGREHFVEAQVADGNGNSLRFVARFYGPNQLLPAMVINEFTTQGSGKHPDFVEIRVLTAGNLAGACLIEGIPGDWQSRFIFPDLGVEAGDYVVVHFKPQGLSTEVNETSDKTASLGYDASPTAWDFWVDSGDGLSANNGALLLCESPLGGAIDAVLYSNRTRESDDRYRGFGSPSVLGYADFLGESGAWRGEEPLVPDDAINPEDSTATRSMCRSATSADTNTRLDWHIVPTRGLSPGLPNTDATYEG